MSTYIKTSGLKRSFWGWPKNSIITPKSVFWLKLPKMPQNAEVAELSTFTARYELSRTYLSHSVHRYEITRTHVLSVSLAFFDQNFDFRDIPRAIGSVYLLQYFTMKLVVRDISYLADRMGNYF